VNPNDLLRLLRRFRFVAIVIALVVMAAGTAVALRSPNRYESSATVIVDPPFHAESHGAPLSDV